MIYFFWKWQLFLFGLLKPFNYKASSSLYNMHYKIYVKDKAKTLKYNRDEVIKYLFYEYQNLFCVPSLYKKKETSNSFIDKIL